MIKTGNETPSMIRATNVSAGYPGHPVLEDIDLKIPAGQVTVIVGPNGCGKSTLLKTIVGILPKTGGTVTVDGQDTAVMTPKEMAQKVAYLAQSRQIPDITALRMVLHGRFPYLGYPRRYRPQDLEIARRAMRQMNIEHLEDKPLNALSGGMRQKVYIAMALAQDTPVILMDEPTTFLDVAHQLQMMDQARSLAKAGKTVVMVLHDLSLALQNADRVIVMSDGKAAARGEPEEVYTSGCLDRVLGVTIKRVMTEDGWKYYYGN